MSDPIYIRVDISINSDVAVMRFCASSKLGSNCKLQKWCLEAQQNNILRA